MSNRNSAGSPWRIEVSAWFEFAKVHHRQQVGEGAGAENPKRGLEQNAVGGFSYVSVASRRLFLAGRRVRLIPHLSKCSEQVRCVGRRLPDEPIDLPSKVRVSRARGIEERAPVVGVAR